MNTKNKIILSALVSMLLIPKISGALEIRQEPYTYQMAMVRDVTTNTFVIGEWDSSRGAPAYRCHIAQVLFELGSAVLQPMAAETLLSDLKQCEGMDMTLQVTGHACQLGPEKFNQILSQQRARTVARFLQEHGFAVATVLGKGSGQPVTDEPMEYFKNRRVEITVQQ
jgi:outer membrane protein OmpA-like peptidoglycan-associated protein